MHNWPVRDRQHYTVTDPSLCHSVQKAADAIGACGYVLYRALVFKVKIAIKMKVTVLMTSYAQVPFVLYNC